MSESMSDVKTTVYPIVLGVADDAHSLVAERLIELHPRFEASHVLSNAISTFELIKATQPAIVLMADASPGVRGTDLVGDIFAASPQTLIIMLATGSDTAYLRQFEEVFHSATIADPTTINNALDTAVQYLDNPEAVESPDGPTRRQRDRRQRQDWSQVFAERRSSSNRTD